MPNKFLIVFILATLSSCKKLCHKDLLFGEVLIIPIEFKNFSENDVNQIMLYRIDKDGSLKKDTFRLTNFVFISDMKSKNVNITDRDESHKFDHYGSYFNNCDLIFDWETGTDTFKNIEVLKSKHVVDKCHEDDPNVRIDHFSFFHKGSVIRKDETVIIEK